MFVGGIPTEGELWGWMMECCGAQEQGPALNASEKTVPGVLKKHQILAMNVSEKPESCLKAGLEEAGGVSRAVP